MTNTNNPAIPNISKPRDAAEVHDLYRRTLAASWSRQPNELPADECIEDIFSGGNGWKTKKESHSNHDTDEEDGEHYGGTLRPSDFRRYANNHHRRSNSGQSQSRHRRAHSASSDRSAATVTGGAGTSSRSSHRRPARLHHEDSRDSRDDDLGSSRSGSLGSLAPTLGSSSDGGRDTGMRRAKEVDEFDVRDDLVAWRLPGGVAA